MRARIVDAGFLVALLLVASAPLWPVYETPRVFAVVGGGLVVGGGTAVLGARLRWPGSVVALATAALLALVGVPLAVPTGTVAVVFPTLEGIRSFGAAAVFGWKDMLSVALPLGDFGALLVPTLLIVSLAAAVGMSVVLRASRPAWALVAPLSVLVFGLAFGGKQPLVPAVIGGVFVVLALLWAARGIGVVRRGRGHLARTVAAGVLIAVTVAAGAGITTALPDPSRAVARDAVVPPFEPHNEVSPLVAYRNSVLSPGSSEIMLRVTGLAKGERLRLAVLDDFDGRVFAVGAHPDAAVAGVYERVPLRVNQDSAAPGRSARITVEVDGYRGTWLPTAGALTSVALPSADASDFFYNREAGAGALTRGVERGLRYSMETVIPELADDKRLAKARPAPAGGEEEVPSALIEAVTMHAGDGTPGQRLVALATWLRAGFVSDGGDGEPFSRSGHSTDRLTQLVEADPLVGDAEQYAPAFALMARQLGFPSRVVVGYAPTGERVTGSDLTAWVEVRTADGEWLAVDPNPTSRDTPEDKRETADIVAVPETVLPPPPPTQQDAVSSAGSDGDDRKPEPDLPEWQRILNTALGVAAVTAPLLATLFAPLWAPALVRGVIRWRRRRSDRQGRVLTGAWLEVRDRVAALGQPIPAAATRREVATISGNDLAGLADRADRVVFDGYRPTRAEVNEYWANVRSARVLMFRALGFRARVMVLLSWRGILGVGHSDVRASKGKR